MIAGRLVTIDGITFDSDGNKVSMAATAYVMPASQGLFAGATPAGPAVTGATPQAASGTRLGDPHADGGGDSVMGKESSVTHFVKDLIEDLKENRLWPIAVGLALALIAIPVVLSKPAKNSSGRRRPPRPATTGASLTASRCPSSSRAVNVSSAAGSTERKSVDRLSRKNPFEPLVKPKVASTDSASAAPPRPAAAPRPAPAPRQARVRRARAPRPRPAAAAPRQHRKWLLGRHILHVRREGQVRRARRDEEHDAPAAALPAQLRQPDRGLHGRDPGRREGRLPGLRRAPISRSRATATASPAPTSASSST